DIARCSAGKCGGRRACPSHQGGTGEGHPGRGSAGVVEKRSLMAELKIFCGNANRPLAEGICDYLGVSLGKAMVTTFKNGETRVKIEEHVRGADVFVIQSTSAPADHHIMELLLMIDALKRASADRVTAVIPYYAYAKQ